MIPVLRSELTKAVTLPSIILTALCALVLPPALAFVTGLTHRPTDHRWDSFPIESHGFEVAGFGQPLVVLLAALIAGTEYLDRQLRTTLTATPRRGRVVAAKLLLAGVGGAAIGLIATGAAVLLKHAALGPDGLRLSQVTTGMAWNLAGVALNFGLMSLIAAALTILARSVIVTLVVLVPMVLGITIGLVRALPALKFLPDLAGIQLLTGYPGLGLLEPAPGALVMSAWALALAASAAIVFRRRDTGG